MRKLLHEPDEHKTRMLDVKRVVRRRIICDSDAASLRALWKTCFYSVRQWCKIQRLNGDEAAAPQEVGKLVSSGRLLAEWIR
jgi:hypothetical protein